MPKIAQAFINLKKVGSLVRRFCVSVLICVYVRVVAPMIECLRAYIFWSSPCEEREGRNNEDAESMDENVIIFGIVFRIK